MIYLDDFVFPSMPERISVSTGASYQTYSLLDRKIAVPKRAGGKPSLPFDGAATPPHRTGRYREVKGDVQPTTGHIHSGGRSGQF